VREVRRIEEREDDPPEDEMDVSFRTDLNLEKMKLDKEGGVGAPPSKRSRKR
jgi:hypothetical protein